MNRWTVLEALRQITHLDEQGAIAQALPLCEAAMNEILRRKKDESDPDDQRLVKAAAAMAYYDLSILETSDEDGLASFKAGDVTVSRNAFAMLERAQLIRKEAVNNALCLLRDEDFYFESV